MTDYKLMPKQITKEMAKAFWEEYSKDRADDLLMRCYRAMYAVAPQPDVQRETIRRAIVALERYTYDPLAGRNSARELRELLDASPTM